ncbi:MAG: hypothetical protein SFV19_05990 [Rhodospirillaceae bacterium]|nr:hypothetical protein [Rhodospirillaceae bacterium]
MADPEKGTSKPGIIVKSSQIDEDTYPIRQLSRSAQMTIDSNGLVYLGTIDDVVLRFPWPGTNVKRKNFLINTILDHAFFGNALLINDGYLINHPEARRDLLKGENSIILALIREGFIRILTRMSDIEQYHDMPVQMAKKIKSYELLVADKSKWRPLRRTLVKLGSELAKNKHYYGWPPVDMGDGFRILLERVAEEPAGQTIEKLGFRTNYVYGVEKVFDKVINKLNKEPTTAARDFFEKTQYEVVNDTRQISEAGGRCFTSDLMGLANEIYHINFGINLDYHFRNSSLRFSVTSETRFARAFNDLLAVETNSLPADQTIPLLDLPHFAIQLEPELIRALVRTDTPIGKAKGLFLAEANAFVSGKVARKDAEMAAKAYANALAVHFAAPRTAEQRSWLASIGFAAVGALAGMPLPDVGFAKFASELTLGTIMSRFGEPGYWKLRSQLKRPKIEKVLLRGLSEQKRSLHNQRTLIGAVRFDPKMTEPIARRVKRFD